MARMAACGGLIMAVNSVMPIIPRLETLKPNKQYTYIHHKKQVHIQNNNERKRAALKFMQLQLILPCPAC